MLGIDSVSILNEHTTCYIHMVQQVLMVITTHMIHQMTHEAKNDKMSENSDSKIIESFLKNSQEFEENHKAISSHS